MAEFRTPFLDLRDEAKRFSDAEFAGKKKLTRHERFLAEIEAATPRQALVTTLLLGECTKVEHCVHVVRCLFKHRKTRDRGPAKNNAQLFTLFCVANLVLAGN